MNSLTFRAFSLALLGLFLFQPPAHAAEPVATVVAARGEVQALASNGQGRKLTVKALIYADDTLQTDARSRVQIMFTDNTLISLGTATTMKIAEYRWQPERNDGALKTRIKEGSFRVMGGALAHAAPQNFKTETPTATIGIRGSMYAGVASADSLSVVFQGGKGIEINNSFGTVTITQPGYGSKAALGTSPTPPVKFSAAELGELNKALNANGTEGKEEPLAAKEPDQQPDSATPGQDNTDSEAAAVPPPEPTSKSGADSTVTDPATQVAAVTDQLTTVANDTSQSTLSTTVDEPPPATTLWSGNYRFLLRDIDLTKPDPTHSNSTFLNYESGATKTTTLLDTGELQGTLANGDTFGPYLINGYNPTATSYAGFSTSTDTVSYLDATLGPLNLTSTTYADLSGQFFFNTIYNTIDSTTDYLIGRLIYAGIPSTTIPTEGLNLYTGYVMHNNTSGTSYDANLEQMSLEISYYNRRIIGRTSDMDPSIGMKDGAIFFGTLNSDGTAEVNIITGGNPSPGSPAVIVGATPAGGPGITSSSGTATATLYGTYNQGLGFTGSGADYSLFDNTQTSTWEATGAALRSPTTKLISNYPTSPQIYTGFVVGVADDTSTGAASRIFMNSTAGDFSMTANSTTGVLTGTINAAELTSSGAMALTGLSVGGTAATSAYINTEDLVALLSGSNLALLGSGNVLYNNGPGTPQITSVANDYLTWGYWEMAYTDPLDGSQDHLFSSQSFFVAGLQTDPAYLDSLMNTPFSGTYTGKAFGVELDPTGQNATPLTNGVTNLTVDFRAPSAANAVTGSINFDQAALAINSVANSLSNSGFTAYVSAVNGAAPTASAVNGAFYGPTAGGIGGNFNAQMSTGTSYLGIFGGSR